MVQETWIELMLQSEDHQAQKADDADEVQMQPAGEFPVDLEGGSIFWF